MPNDPIEDEIQAPNFVAQAGQDEENTVIANLAFYPDILLLHFQQSYRVDETHLPERQIHALKTALREVNQDLQTWRKTLTPPPQTLEETPGDVYGTGENAEHEKVSDYLTAVYAKAKAKLIERYRDYDTTKAGRDRDEDIIPNADEYHQESREAVRRILGTGRMTVELL